MLSLHMLPGIDKNNLVCFLLGHICVTSILWKMICFSLDKTATFLQFGAVLFYVKQDKIELFFCQFHGKPFLIGGGVGTMETEVCGKCNSSVTRMCPFMVSLMFKHAVAVLSFGNSLTRSLSIKLLNPV